MVNRAAHRAEPAGPDLLPEWRVDVSTMVEAGPDCALEVTLRLTDQDNRVPGAEIAGCVRALGELDTSWGGSGLVLDPTGCRAEGGFLTLLLRPLDLRRSKERFERMIDLIQPPGVPSTPVGRPDWSAEDLRQLLDRIGAGLCDAPENEPESETGDPLDRARGLSHRIADVRLAV